MKKELYYRQAAALAAAQDFAADDIRDFFHD